MAKMIQRKIVVCVFLVICLIYANGQLGAQSGSPLSYGAVTAKVKKGITTQTDIITWWGGPNITTIDSEGLETWVYERSSSDTDVNYDRNQKTDAKNSTTGKYIGIPLIAGYGSTQQEGQAEVHESGGHKTTHSVKTLTVIFKFNKNATVKDYAVRQSNF